MADDVPVCDVLCEAMEYLSKLGSNLRTRSENLKEKRIRKDKLKNYHAVQKAADKVLLICQLSKKSLENVESGVRKVLTMMSAGQNSVSADKETPPGSSTTQESEYRYFKYRSYKLKVAKKVPVKHYMSVRVLARNMSMSMHDKYPVYHNCKLYRSRKKREEQENLRKSKKNQGDSKTKNKDSLKENKTEESDDSVEENKEQSSKEVELEENSKNRKMSVCSDNLEKSSHNNVDRTPKKICSGSETKSDDLEKSSIDNMKTKSLSKSRTESKDYNSSNEELSSKRRNSQNKRIRIVDDDSSDSSRSNDKFKNCDSKVTDCQKENSAPNNEESVSTLEINEGHLIDINSKPEINNSKDSESEEEKIVEIERKEAPIQPVIKCVNISKLLKPDIAENLKESPVKSKAKQSKNSDSDKDMPLNKENNRNTSKKKRQSLEINEDFWVDKRKEVSAFVSKKFVINLMRLPVLSENFLLKHNLRKVIQGNNIICETPQEKHVTEKANSNSKSRKSPSPRLKAVRSALLNDSDSDKNASGNISPQPSNVVEEFNENDKNKPKKSIDNIKDALLNDSESDTEISIRRDNNDEKQSSIESGTKETELKQALLAESDSENDTHSKSTKNGNDNQNSKDLIDADDTITNSEKQAEVSPNKDSQVPSNKQKKHKRKHMMESMHAKKMLLTYSSSSDTEDEQLRSALKEIKDSLLKGASSSDDEKKKKVSKNASSSENEDNLTKRRKKRRKDSSDEDSDKKKQELAEKKVDSDQASRSSKKSSVTSDENIKHKKKKMGRSRAQPGGSSQNSDSQDPNDKDIDGLTNLNNLSKNRRRRDSTSTNATDTNSIKKSSKMAKAPLISEDMLKAESSSDAASVADSDPGEDAVEELPSISLSGMNGSGVDHLAKDDLLEESDTSGSNRGDSDANEVKKTDESDEEEVKSKRRKAPQISSDSEAGSSRRNIEKAVKVSDFEDSEDENSEPAKRSKRKKKGEESDASVGSSSSNDGSKKKRRRIKQLDSDGSGSDTENEGRNKHGRKNIRKVMGKNQLEEATKKAAREEKERIARIAERQKLYNNLEFDESGKPDEVVLEKVILDFDPETKEPLIQVDRGLVKKLKPHQANGIKFMWDACFESVKRIKKDKGSGCILAHCMGLGKTLQVVSLTHTLLTHSPLTSVQRVLVVCPLSTVLNWVNEFKMWLKHAETDFDVDVYELSRHKQNSERAFQLQQWFEGGGVCVLGYEMFRNLSADNSKKFKKKMLRHFQESLVDPGPDLVVCDEGHLLKNEKTSLSQSMNRVKTRRRIVLTGTPLQNNLKEYYCMVQFVKPNLLGKYNEYLNRFVNPITNGQYTDSTEHDIRIMKRRSHVLHKMLDGAVQRRDYGVLAPFLPPKHEYVLFITLTDVQVKLYQYYLDNYSRRPLPGKSSGFLFPDFQSLQRIWTHPLVLKYNSERYEIMQQKKREREEEDSEGSLVDFIDDDSTPEESSTEESSDDLSDMSDDSRKKSKKKKSAKKSKAKDTKVSTRRGTRANPVEMEEEEPREVVELKNENPTEWWIRLVDEDELDDVRNSHKLVLLFDILRQCETIGDKLLVFSQSLYSLDLIEHFLGKVDEATQDGRIDEKLGGHVGSWSPGVDYFRLDGSTSCENRSIWCKNFNREDNPRARLFLISTRAGGLGINLVAANRVVIFDVSWNPSHDVQSIFRVYRFGQKKPCYIYRFLAMGTMEEKIYERQVTKQAISKRVIDEQQIDRHYAENDLAELYKFEARPPAPRPTPPLPKDRLFAEMLREHEAQIYKYHEHDSLLENKEEETLSEEERKAAWEDFENEKNRPPPAPFPSAWPMHNGMVPGLLAQQQQQLAYAALAAMLRKDMPNINDNQIRDMLPLIYNANPAMFGGYDYGLMQKMSEIYKYSQPGMMNPMMNPVMNAGSGGGGGGVLGGSSGLQYEPPWQRQHQQQQQLRLQQLMQQNQMGAKYYAGGLGSRDPVAMALQQQRAREIMAGERGRPRGRPPLQRAPPPDHADVVNLDSD